MKSSTRPKFIEFLLNNLSFSNISILESGEIIYSLQPYLLHPQSQILITYLIWDMKRKEGFEGQLNKEEILKVRGKNIRMNKYE
jgi:hypothetical protein